ncbi:hypothetical protein [Anabaena sp. CCY 0017]
MRKFNKYLFVFFVVCDRLRRSFAHRLRWGFAHRLNLIIFLKAIA